MIRACGLVKRFEGGITAVEGVEFEVPAGGTLRLAGPSGSGKTTVLRLLAGLERPDAGEIWLDGRMASRPGLCTPPHLRGLSMAFQRPALWPHMTVAQNVAFGLIALPKRERRERVHHLLASLDLLPLAARRPRVLSGGEAQRVALARALAPRVPILLLDEPFAHLDLTMKTKAASLIREEKHAAGATVVFVSHDGCSALLPADRTVELGEGRMTAGTPAGSGP